MRCWERFCSIPPHVRYGFIRIIESGYTARYYSKSFQRRWFIGGLEENLHPNTDSEVRSPRLNVVAQWFEKTTIGQVLNCRFESTNTREDETLISLKSNSGNSNSNSKNKNVNIWFFYFDKNKFLRTVAFAKSEGWEIHVNSCPSFVSELARLWTFPAP